jgi:hypothetical protein
LFLHAAVTSPVSTVSAACKAGVCLP